MWVFFDTHAGCWRRVDDWRCFLKVPSWVGSFCVGLHDGQFLFRVVWFPVEQRYNLFCSVKRWTFVCFRLLLADALSCIMHGAATGVEDDDFGRGYLWWGFGMD